MRFFSGALRVLLQHHVDIPGIESSVRELLMLLKLSADWSKGRMYHLLSQ